MKTAVILWSQISLYALIFGFSAKSHADSKKSNDAIQKAIGIVDVFLFKDRRLSYRCVATHIGQGVMVTSGHCFLGAYDCNDAKVTWEKENFVSKCQYVIYSNASEAYSNGREISNDLTAFKVDRFPEASVQRPLSKAESTLLQSMPEQVQNSFYAVTKFSTDSSSMGGQRPAVTATNESRASSTTETRSSAPCKLILGPISNIFLQPKPSDTARHTCELSGIASGAPIISASDNRLVAIHQGSSTLPNLESNPSGVVNEPVHFAKVLADLDFKKITGLPEVLPENIRIGGFAGEVFSTGIDRPVKLKVANLQARLGQSTVSFRVHNGLDSIVEVVSGDGKSMIFGGPRRAGYEQRFQFKAPARVMLTGTRDGVAPLAWLEDIQSP
jgi:hypothetical protein